MKDNLQLIGQVILIVLGPLLAKHGVTVGNNEVDDILAALSEAFGIAWKFIHWHKTPDAPSAMANPGNGSQSGFARLSLMFLTALFTGIAAALLIAGCAHIQPGQDPIVVNAERAQTIAAPSFDLVLETDNSNRPFWKKNAPDFHSFCEWLRERQIAYLADGTPTNVQRSIAMQLNLDKVKLDYKASKVSSNAVIEAIATLQSVQQQADAWLTVVTNQPTQLAPLQLEQMPEVSPLLQPEPMPLINYLNQ